MSSNLLTGDKLTDTFVRIFVLNKELGRLLAHQNWCGCHDPNNKTSFSHTIKRSIGVVNGQIKNLMACLSFVLSEDEISVLKTECTSIMETSLELTESSIEVEHRPVDLNWNKDALIVLVDQEIPEDIKICLSFGYKFLSPYMVRDSNLHEILAQLELCIENAIPEAKHYEASLDIYHVLKARKVVQTDDVKNWLAFIQFRTSAFFRNNPQLFATKSDKGGHTVILYTIDYETKLCSHLNEGKYELVDYNPLQDLVQTERDLVERIYLTTCSEQAPAPVSMLCKEIFEGVRASFEPDTLHLSKFYGLPKIHKPDIPLRPITSTIGSPGYFTAKRFNRLLQHIFPSSDTHIKDTFKFVEFIRGIKLSTGDILVSFDVVSMFTSIPYELVFDIIMSKADNFRQIFNIDRPLLVDILNFLLKDCMVFTALDNIYRQVDGIPMGSCLSPTIARIVMDVIVEHLFAHVSQITFIRVFVDDTILAINKDCVNLALDTLNNFRPGQIKFTLELENNHASINFLNTTLTREDRLCITTKWYRKSFASGRLLNYFSSHKRTTVMATAENFIRTTLLLSDESHFSSNKQIVEDTLRDNSFPETTIMTLLNNIYTLMKPIKTKSSDSPPSNQNRDTSKEYVIFPHSICEGRRIKAIIQHFKNPEVILADSVRNTRINSITTRKTKIPIAKRKNLILISRCRCKQRYKVVRTNFNETGEMARRRIITPLKRKCGKHNHAYHKVQFHKGLHYHSQTSVLAKYIQWIYRHNIEYLDSPYEFPNGHLRKLVDRSKFKSKST